MVQADKSATLSCNNEQTVFVPFCKGRRLHNKDGLNVHAVVFDELHAQPNRELFDVMTKGSGDARLQPLFFKITTAGADRNSICYEQHQKAQDIIDGRKINNIFYPVIYGIGDNDH